MKKTPVFVMGLISIYLICGHVYADSRGNRKIQSFTKAKRILIRQIYRGHQTTFYCSSQYTQGKHVIHNNGYVPQRKSKRARRLAWDHVVSLNAFSDKFSEWRDGHPACLDSMGRPFKGRNCAEKMNIKFRYLQSDLYNLVPAISEIKWLRSNSRFGMIQGEAQNFGNCDIEITSDTIEPPLEVRGDIARIYFYMDWAYPGYDIIRKNDSQLFKTWNKLDPVDAWECLRAKRIEEIQKNENPFVKKTCIDKGLWQ